MPTVLFASSLGLVQSQGAFPCRHPALVLEEEERCELACPFPFRAWLFCERAPSSTGSLTNQAMCIVWSCDKVLRAQGTFPLGVRTALVIITPIFAKDSLLRNLLFTVSDDRMSNFEPPYTNYH